MKEYVEFSVKKFVFLATVAFSLIGASVLLWAGIFYFMNSQEEISINKNIVRCIIDENFTNPNSLSCKRVLVLCSENRAGVCEKIISMSEQQEFLDKVLSVMGDICQNGGESACGLIVDRCIENGSNCSTEGKNYSVKSYLQMKADDKNSGKALIVNKIKKYYDTGIDNIVNSVAETCETHKHSIACSIFSSKVYLFKPEHKSYFTFIQNNKNQGYFRKLEFSTKGAMLSKPFAVSTLSASSQIEEEKKEAGLQEKTAEETLNKEEIKLETEESKQENRELISQTLKNTENIEPEIIETKENQTNSENQPASYRAFMLTGEENNIDLIKSKVYELLISYIEPANTHMRWLISFDDRATWKKWTGSIWLPVDTTMGLENTNFSQLGNRTSEIIKGLRNYIVQPDETSLDFAVEFEAKDESSTPILEKIEIKYY